MEKEIGISEKIKKRILDKGQGKLHCVADFYDLGNDRVVRQAFDSLGKERNFRTSEKRGLSTSGSRRRDRCFASLFR